MNKKIKLILGFILMRTVVANLVHPVTPSFLINLNFPDYMFGLAFAMMALANFFFSPFWGKISKNFGDVKIYGLSYIGYGFGQFLFMTATSTWQLLIARLIAGLFVGGQLVNELIYISNNSPIEKRAKNLAISGTIMGVFPAFGYLIGGVIGNYSIMAAFMTQVIALISLGVAAWILLSDSITKEKISFKTLVKTSNPFVSFIYIRKYLNRQMILFFLVVLFSIIASTAFGQTFNYYIIDELNFTIINNGYIKAVIGLISLVFNSVITLYIIRKTNIHKSYIKVLIASVILVSSVLLLHGKIVFVILSILIFGMIAMYIPLLQAKLSDINVENSEIVLGFYNSVKGMGSFLGSLLVGFIYAINSQFSFGFVIGTLGLAICLAVINLRPKM